MAVAAKPGARAWAERPSVQILVVVANIQMRTLKAEEEKVPCEWYLHMGKLILRDGVTPADSAITCVAQKGIGLRFHEPGRGG